MRRLFFWVLTPFMVLALLAWRLIPSARPVPSASAVRWFLIHLSTVVVVASLAWHLYSKSVTRGRPETGLIVEDPVVEAPHALRAGDLLLGWERTVDASRGAMGGPLRSPFDLAHILLTLAPRGGLRISGVRGGDPLISPSSWLFPTPITRPLLNESDEKIYMAGRELLAAGRRDEALSLWQGTAQSWRRDGMKRQACWLFFVIAQQLADDRQWHRAQTSYLEAIAEAGHDEPHVVAFIKLALARGLENRLELDLATATYYEALAIRQAIDPEGLSVADVLFNLGSMAVRKGDPERGEGWHARALSLRQDVAPASYEVVQSLGALAAIAAAKGDRERAYDLYQRAVAAHRPLLPTGRRLVGGLDPLGMAISPVEESVPLRLGLDHPSKLAANPDHNSPRARPSYSTPASPSTAHGTKATVDPPLHGLEE